MDERKLIFQNLLNGVPVWQVALHFHKSESDINDIFKYGCIKIKNYLFERRMPPIFCDTLEEAKKNRLMLLPLLDKVNLDRKPKFGKVQYHKVDGNNIFEMRTK